MTIPPPRNGYWYTAREIMMQRDQLRRGRERSFVFCAPALALIAGPVGIGAAIGAVTIMMFGLAISIVLWAAFRVYIDDRRIMMFLQAPVIPIALLIDVANPLAWLAFPLWALALYGLDRAAQEPSEIERADAATRLAAPPRLRE